MKYRILWIVLPLVGAIALAGCGKTEVNESQPRVSRDFTVDVSGTEGLMVDLLVILKPNPSSIVKAVDERVTLPYKKDFTGVAWAIWVDGIYSGQEGEYTLRTDGSSASGIVKEGVQDQSVLYNL